MVKAKNKLATKVKKSIAKPTKPAKKLAKSVKAPKNKKAGTGKQTQNGKKDEDKYQAMSVDEFLDKDFENSDDDDLDLDEELAQDQDSDEEVHFSGGESDDAENEDDEAGEAGEDEEAPSGDEANSSGDEALNHKKSLDKLRQTDPEFYKFLQDNDQKLLQFNLSDDEGDAEEKEEVDEDADTLHKPADELEVASDESDFEDEGAAPKSSGVITLKMLKTWQSEIKTDKSNKTLTTLAQAFHAALMRVSAPDEEDAEPAHFRVEGSSVFNAVIQLCVLEFGPAVRRFLGLTRSKQAPHKCKKFVKVKRTLKCYFTDLLKLLHGVTSANIQTVLLKHLHYMATMLTSYPTVAKLIVKRLVSIWGTADEGVRVVAFLCILRITHNQQAALLDTVLKSMYMTYVKNSKFVSLNGLAGINFMRRSLVEMFCLDLNIAYQHVFLYIRQLAIHLRNAITVNKKENVQSVYNWQYVNSLKLWGTLLTVTANKPQLQQLVYPLVQVCLGVLKLVPTAQFYPLRFHVVQILMDLSRDTGVFIPILPFILEVLNSYDINKKHQKVSMKPLQFTCLLRLSKSQLQENGFKDTLIETIYGQLLEYLSSQSHSIAFPDLSLVCLLQLKQFIKKCKNANYNRKIKQVIEKIEQNSQFIENERRHITFNITDFKKIEGWETQLKNKGTPFTTFYESWNKIRNIKKNKELTNNEKLGEYNLPTLKKHTKKVAEVKNSDGKVELFPSDSEDEEEVEVKKTRGKRAGKNINKRFEDHSGPVLDTGETDLVQDIDMEDW